MRHVVFVSVLLAIAAGPGCSRPPSMVVDATGKTVGEVIRWDDRVPQYPLNAVVRYQVSGDDVALIATTGSIQGTQQTGGSVALFTTPDCSGNDMFVMLQSPTLTKRYGMVLSSGSPSTWYYEPTQGWLWATDPLPSRVSPGATVFHSQWADPACSPYPAPGYVVTGTPLGGYWMHRVEDLYVKFARPFYFK